MPTGYPETCFLGVCCQEDHTRQVRGVTPCITCEELHPWFHVRLAKAEGSFEKVKHYWQRKKEAKISAGQWPCATNDPVHFTRNWYEAISPMTKGPCGPVTSANRLCTTCLPLFQTAFPGMIWGLFNDGYPVYECIRLSNLFGGELAEVLRQVIPETVQCSRYVRLRYSICGTCMAVVRPRIQTSGLTGENWHQLSQNTMRLVSFRRWFTIEGYLSNPNALLAASQAHSGSASGPANLGITGL
ncbi:hypothetical protein BS50DRAFT_593135 [Corynespora cassiicola Philippines]|uniref:Uncharacterized protein n=1 Tax=Corynespora cassiicola Philippines TaxID=1448308 RepID=A0A2T2N719_CORCC|nr:hypothetical protein BS50DRAFT_593135 [Corynespora cassiicola Philippines]